MNKIKALLLLLIGLLQYRLWFGDGNVLEFQRLNDRIAELQQEGAKRRERNAALEAEVIDLKQGLDAVEERARHELGMVKEGEVFVQVIEPARESDAHPAAPNAGTAKDKTEKAKSGVSDTAKDKNPPARTPKESPASAVPPKQKAIARVKPQTQAAPAKPAKTQKSAEKPATFEIQRQEAAPDEPHEDADR